MLRASMGWTPIVLFVGFSLVTAGAAAGGCGLAGAESDSGFGGAGTTTTTHGPSGGGVSTFSGPSAGGSTSQGGSPATSGGGAGSSGGNGGGGSSASSTSAASSAVASSTAASSTAASSTAASSSSTGGPVDCDNGQIDPGEECDDQSGSGDHGCSATCQLENEHSDTCNGTAIKLTPGETMRIAQSTAGADDTFQHAAGGGCITADYPGADLIYAVSPTANGTLHARLDASYNTHVLRARDACVEKNDLDCDYHAFNGTPDQISFSVNAGSTYYVIVDSYQSTSGPFELTLSL
jgi:cysteine-rich repeat protein